MEGKTEKVEKSPYVGLRDQVIKVIKTDFEKRNINYPVVPSPKGPDGIVIEIDDSYQKNVVTDQAKKAIRRDRDLFSRLYGSIWNFTHV